MGSPEGIGFQVNLPDSILFTRAVIFDSMKHDLQRKNIEVRMNGKTYHCALDITMDYLGGKWKAVVLWYIRDEVPGASAS